MPSRINIPALRANEPGAYSRFPFNMLQPGDEMFVPNMRCDKRSVDEAVRRWKKKVPTWRLSTEKIEGGTLVRRLMA